MDPMQEGNVTVCSDVKTTASTFRFECRSSGLGPKYTTFVTDNNSHKFEIYWRRLSRSFSIICLDNFKRNLRILAEVIPKSQNCSDSAKNVNGLFKSFESLERRLPNCICCRLMRSKSWHLIVEFAEPMLKISWTLLAELAPLKVNC